jgi:hypothetical protein
MVGDFHSCGGILLALVVASKLAEQPGGKGFALALFREKERIKQ